MISALLGLVGACNNNPKTAVTDRIVIKALAVPVLCPVSDDEILSGIIGEIYAEKNAVAPDCARCASPCGNASDYDMSRIYKAEPEIRDLKLQLLSKCQKLAAYVYRDKALADTVQIDCTHFYKILSCISYEIGKEQLLALLDETEVIGKEIEGKTTNGKKNY